MNSFEWVSVSSLAEATSAASDTVANAMRSQSGQPKTEAIILKAGGVDLLDLMKEGLLSPRRVINLHSVAELRGIVEEPNGSIRIGSMVTLAQLAEHPLLRALPRPSRRRQPVGQPANPAGGHDRGQPVAAATLLVFPLAGPPLRAQRRRGMLRVYR